MKKSDDEKSAMVEETQYGLKEKVPHSGAGSIEGWCEKNKVEAWIHKATKLKHKWADGAEVSEADYLAACDACANGKL